MKLGKRIVDGIFLSVLLLSLGKRDRAGPGRFLYFEPLVCFFNDRSIPKELLAAHPGKPYNF